MNIGILGSGDVGRRLGDGLIALGHKVKIGTRARDVRHQALPAPVVQ